MSQKLVYALLKELGGKASASQVRALAKAKYPKASLYTYVFQRLRQLAKWGYVAHMSDDTWTILMDYEN